MINLFLGVIIINFKRYHNLCGNKKEGGRERKESEQKRREKYQWIHKVQLKFSQLKIIPNKTYHEMKNTF